MPHFRGAQNELIFVNNGCCSKSTNIPSQPSQNLQEDDEQVDLEIIILEPKRKSRMRPAEEAKLRPSEGSLRSVKSINGTGKTPPDNSAAKQDTVVKGAKVDKSSPNEVLLKQLEMRYGQKVLKPDDETYVDYMDYF